MKCLVRCVIAMINETLLKTLIVIISLLAIGFEQQLESC